VTSVFIFISETKQMTSLFSSSLPSVHKHSLLSPTCCGRLLKYFRDRCFMESS